MTDIGTLGGSASQAYDINDSGQVVGASATTNGVFRAFWYSNGSIVNLVAGAGASSNQASAAYAINNAGAIVGHSDYNGAARFVYGGVQWFCCGSSASTAYGVNMVGQVVGQRSIGDQHEAGMWGVDGNFLPDGNFWPLRPDYSSAVAINDAGLCVIGVEILARGGPVT